jgi:hypothetical protein
MTNGLPHGAAPETPNGDDHPAVAALQRSLAQLEARVAHLEQPAARWLPLKAAAIDAGVKYETARTWAESGLIEARRDGKRWLVNLTSLKARKDLWLRGSGFGREADQ